MDAEEKRAIKLIKEANERIKEAVEILMKRYGRMVIAICEDFVGNDAGQEMAENVISHAVRTLDSYQGSTLEGTLYQLAEEIAKAKRDSMRPDLWRLDRMEQEREGKVSEEDYRLIRYKKHTSLTWKKIGAIFGMTEGQAKTRAHRALKILSGKINHE